MAKYLENPKLLIKKMAHLIKKSGQEEKAFTLASTFSNVEVINHKPNSLISINPSKKSK